MFEETKLSQIESEKLLKLKSVIQNHKSALIAYSGGIDSTLLAYVSHHILSQKSLIITVDSDFFSGEELEETKSLATKYDFNYKIIKLNIFENPDITGNSAQRCRYCKKLIFENLIKLAQKEGFDSVFDGSNIDDLKDYRPGFEAIQELGVISPFIEAGFSKADIINIAKSLGLPNWHKPASACLATRIPYGTSVTKEILKMVEESEIYIKKLGYKGFRVRHHNKVARIELNPDDISSFVSKHREEVDLKLKELGYNYVCVDLHGYKTGSLNILI
jgi:uncharacterized protein